MVNAVVSSTIAERPEELGDIAPDRLRSTPAPGTATIEDLTIANSQGKPICELIDQSLVEKAMGFEASVVAAVIARILGNFVSSHRHGLVSGADGMFQLITSPSAVRILREEDIIDGGEVLPGFSHPVAEFFADLDLGLE